MVGTLFFLQLQETEEVEGETGLPPVRMVVVVVVVDVRLLGQVIKERMVVLAQMLQVVILMVVVVEVELLEMELLE